MSGSTLECASFLHLCKVTFDRASVGTASAATANSADAVESANLVPNGRRPALTASEFGGPKAPADRDWYLRDPRWLSARPLQVGWNPLADLSALFPHLSRLEVALTQLTGPMLLRLLYQTPLSVLILTQVPSHAASFEFNPRLSMLCV